MFKFTFFSFETEAHLVIRTAFVDMFIWTINASSTLIFHKLETNFEVMTEITLVSVAALTHSFIFIARLDFAFIVRTRTIVIEFAFTMNELFTDTVGGELTRIGGSRRDLRILG